MNQENLEDVIDTSLLWNQRNKAEGAGAKKAKDGEQKPGFDFLGFNIRQGVMTKYV